MDGCCWAGECGVEGGCRREAEGGDGDAIHFLSHQAVLSKLEEDRAAKLGGPRGVSQNCMQIAAAYKALHVITTAA